MGRLREKDQKLAPNPRAMVYFCGVSAVTATKEARAAAGSGVARAPSWED
jgi:hypothetical protein